MKRTTLLFILLLAIFSMAWAQQEWTSPFVGYSSTKVLSVDKVEFQKNKTLLHVTVTAESGYKFFISKDAYLTTEGKRYALRKVTEVGIDKSYTVPDSGKVHFAMQFEPLPMNTRRLHFVEGESPTGWRMFNICSNKNELAMEMPSEWKNVEYADLKHLPESRLCDESTTINVQILNYVPEAGKQVSVQFTPFDGDQYEDVIYATVAPDGTATIKLHPCFPQTVQMRLEGSEPFPILVMPGDTVSFLMDMARGGSNPALAFKGSMARVNYELNVTAETYRTPYNKSTSYFESLLRSGKDVEDELLRHHYDERNKVESIAFYKKEICHATREWLMLDKAYELARQIFVCEDYLNRKVRQELQSAGSTIIKNNSVKPYVKAVHNRDWPGQEISFSKKMTWCPYFTQVWDWKFQNHQGEVNTYNRDIHALRSALQGYQMDADKYEPKMVSKISDPDLKAFYFVATNRWQQYIDSINRIPHLHFEQHQGLEKEVLKKALLDEYRGKNIVLLVYRRPSKEGLHDLNTLEPLMAKADSQRVVFLHIDLCIGDVAGWSATARQYTGEHYYGLRTRYDTMFPQYDWNNPSLYYEFYAPDGTQTLTTSDVEVAKKAIEKLVEE